MAQSQPAGAYIFPQAASVNEFYYIAPGQILTLDVAGLSVTPNAPLSATSLPLPTSLAGISAKIIDLAGTVTLVPLLGVVGTSNCYDSLYSNAPCSGFLAVTVEIPTELAASDPNNDGATFLDQLVLADREQSFAGGEGESGCNSGSHLLRTWIPRVPAAGDHARRNGGQRSTRR